MDDSQLLKILLAEVPPVRLHEVEQSGNDLYHAVEVSGAHFALHHLVQTVEVELERFVHFLGGVHLFGCGGEHKVCAYTVQQFSVALQRTRILGQVLLVVELRGVDKHADHRHVVLAHTASHE